MKIDPHTGEVLDNGPESSPHAAVNGIINQKRATHKRRSAKERLLPPQPECSTTQSANDDSPSLLESAATTEQS